PAATAVGRERPPVVLGNFIHLHAHPHHLPHQPDDVFRVVGPVRVGLDAAAFVFAYLVLVDHPFQGAAVGEAITFRLLVDHHTHATGYVNRQDLAVTQLQERCDTSVRHAVSRSATRACVW